MELISLVSMRGCGELDPEPAGGLLEDADWDVADAFNQLCGGAGAGDYERADEEAADPWERMLSDARIGEAALRAVAAESAALRGGIAAAQRALRGLAGAEAAAAARGVGARPAVALSRERRARREAAAAMAALGGRGLSRQRASDREPSSESAGESHDELEELHDELRLQALLRAMAQQQDEADLQSALRQSASEAYSGGFSAPPADEARLDKDSSTSIFSETVSGDSPGSCAVCLEDFAEGETLRSLGCTHCFHKSCVDQWLACSGQCPTCKTRVG